MSKTQFRNLMLLRHNPSRESLPQAAYNAI